MTTMQLCKKFNYCSAPICSLDPEKHLQDYLPGEPKCSLNRVERQRYKRQARRLDIPL